ncbi:MULTISPECIES: SH3 domain-containing protein [unclassified Sinorhizobium]|uniref:SH3 domain-containing protein n=1 Tax=unclassified Sinorhizobium TaxID=2613772 RepID=UPI0024C469D1|nr:MULTISPECIES: SH3 domain-containing protein [unclassified Sinorhizobium]MDK1376473.1 SH3 domain-containing protein [Sinorhizobium sp. 6-70]MDK1480979.1 SH3 domain-containing protein [Sinorhizobium sp. 6-117]
MSASYQNFWIIVGMTVSATVLANMSAKPERTASSSIEVSRREPTRPPNRMASQTSTSSGTPETNGGNVERGKASQTTSSGLVERQFKDINSEFKASFDAAAQIALATPPASSADHVEQPGPDIPVPSLQMREIQSDPKIFDVEAQTSPSNDPSPTGLGTGVTTTNLNMREGPAANYLLVDVLATGITLVILEQENGWLHVRDGSGRQGWVNGSYVSRTAN